MRDAETMIDHGSFFSCYGDQIELNLPFITEPAFKAIEKYSSNWHLYNPRKTDNPRWGLSLTSLDGGLSGVPDLDSLREFNKIHGTDYRELNFNKMTPVVSDIPELHDILSHLNPLGRCHFIKMNKGGHFPPHRDGGTIWPPVAARLFCTVRNAEAKDMCWLHEGRQLIFKPGRWYLINTTKEHSVFSFVDDCIFTVLNVPLSQQNLNYLLPKLAIA